MIVHDVEVVPLDRLRPHPRNYKRHPDDQLGHIAASLREHGFYRNIVAARDWTILAGHGVYQAAQIAGITDGPVIRLDVEPDSPAAIRVLTSDNELPRFAETDDRALTELLRQLREQADDGLVGTGYDDTMLASLVMVTRPASEIADLNDAALWVGMPEFDSGTAKHPQLILHFDDESARDEVVRTLGIGTFGRKEGLTWSAWWPPREKDDVRALMFVEEPAAS